jgi:hypothetical protein
MIQYEEDITERGAEEMTGIQCTLSFERSICLKHVIFMDLIKVKLKLTDLIALFIFIIYSSFAPHGA